LVAQYFGAKNHKMINYIAGQSMISVLIVGILLSIFGFFLAPTIIKFM
jgi:Na+-driven multidrug efflux pump